MRNEPGSSSAPLAPAQARLRTPRSEVVALVKSTEVSIAKL